MQDLLALGSLVGARFGIPGLVIAGAVYLLARQTKAQIQSDLHALPKGRSFTPSQWASAATVPPMVPCWELKQCDPAKRADCAAYTHSHVPCWLAVAVVEGQTSGRVPDLPAVRSREARGAVPEGDQGPGSRDRAPLRGGNQPAAARVELNAADVSSRREPDPRPPRSRLSRPLRPSLHPPAGVPDDRTSA